MQAREQGFQYVFHRRATSKRWKLGIALELIEATGQFKIVNFDINGLVFKKNLRILSEVPELDDYLLRLGDVIEIVNGPRDVHEIRHHLKTSEFIHMKVIGHTLVY